MDTLISQVWNLYHDITDGIVKPAIPVLYFGNFERCQRSPLKVITVGKNPSSNEFPAFDPFHRFAKARGLYPAILQGEFYREYLDALNSYFQTGTQLDWFDRSYEPVLHGAGWSYYDSSHIVALHTDICSPLATSKPWRDADRAVKQRLEVLGEHLWQRLVNYLAPDVIIASIAGEHRKKITSVPLDAWDDLYTVERRNNYTVKRTSVHLPGGKQALVIYGQDAVMPFQLVSDREKTRIGAAIQQHIQGTVFSAIKPPNDERASVEGSMSLEKVSKSTPLSKPEFHAWLRAWLHSANNLGDSRIDGGTTKYGGSAWLYVHDGRALYRLNADTKRQGVNDYLCLVDRYGDDLAWTTTSNRDGKDNAVAYGPASEPVRRFYLYKV